MSSDREPVPLRALLRYFLGLGTIGFGGPIALAARMQRDLVEARGWFTETDYREGLALAQLAPGPLAAQLAMYLGWVRAGFVGATLVGLAFILPSFLMVLGLSAAYLRFGGLSWMQDAFYGVGAAVIAIIARSATRLTRSTIGRDPLLFGLFVVSALVTAITERELLAIFVASGLIAALAKSPPGFLRRSVPAASVVIAPWWCTGLHGPADAGTFWRIFLFFTESGAVVFGSGLAIVPFLHGGVVDQMHWLDERQFLDAVAVATLLALRFVKKVPEPLLILFAAGLGLLHHAF